MRLDDDLLTRALRESRDRTLSECPPAGEPEHVSPKILSGRCVL